jgi:Ca2+-binding RTX toxin-like protein
MARVFDASGTAVTVELPMNQGEEAFQSDPQAVALIDGGFAISYRSQSSTGSGIRIATFGSGGEFKGNFTVELPEGFSLERAPSISVLSDGRLVVTWVEQDVDAGTYGARSQIFDPRANAVNLSGSELGDQYFGTDLNDYLSGNGGNDTLNGGDGDDVLIGGAGLDVFVGGGGNDIYYIENGDTVIEGGGGGYDTIVASYSATLGDNTQVEVLQAAAGVAPLSLGGANMNDTLIGNDGHNVINGGTGADRMTGQSGNDIYYVDNASDAVIEVSASGGEDHVLASVNFSLGAFVEKLTAIGTLGLALTGNDLDNTIAGNVGRNTIRVGAGADTILGGNGNDLLYGSVGKDVFVFDTTGHKTRNKDKILDWKYRDDTIKLDQDIFKKLKIGKLQSKHFTLGDKAKDANDYIGVNKKTGDVWYDPNGDKPGKQVIFANIGKNKAAFASDFFVF